ncbi:MAG TPA: hypothetical protein VME24_01680 [Alphaproteobacteria bacterium]|nr:hypothetical protein [Alphaproteobacteria bacterium]
MKFRILQPVVSILLSALFLGPAMAMAMEPVLVTINTNGPRSSIPTDFAGLSFETGRLHKDRATGAYFFDSSNAQLLTIFRNLGIKSLRIGGNTVDRGYVPSTDDIDALFRFAKAADVKVIYSLRLANGDAAQDASIARYVWGRYRPWLIDMAIGNEANSYNGLDPQATNAALFTAKWNRFASAVIAATPGVKLGGPDNGNGAFTWVSAFARAEQANTRVDCIFSHYEPGGTSRNKSAEQMIDEMLSPDCDDRRCESCYEKIGRTAESPGWSYRFTEANSHVATPLSRGGNHSFATALFALDFLHWWAAHGCAGVNFHTGFNGFNGGFYTETNGNYGMFPICYGIAAFSAGGRGAADSVTIQNPRHLNLTAYAVTDASNDIFVTIINKEHGRNAREASVRINAGGGLASVMYLKAPDNNVAATLGITLGGSAIDGNHPWQGRWERLVPKGADGCELEVDAPSAAIVKIQP